MKDKNNLWVVVIIAIVVAVIASLITVNLTGNTISVARGFAGPVYTTSETYSKAQVDAKLTNVKSLVGTYYGCYKKGGSTIEWGSNSYTNNSQILSNSVNVECNLGEDALLSDFTCNPRYWQQRTPVYVSGVSMFSRSIGNLTVNGRILACTGGESQGIMNLWCCKKS